MKNTTNTDNQTILLCNGQSVHTDILDLIRFVVQEKIPELSPSKSYTLKQICGEESWDMFDKQIDKIEAGYCMVHLVEMETLPMISSNKCRHQYPKRYQLI
jgi:hypothetical protein